MEQKEAIENVRRNALSGSHSISSVITDPAQQRKGVPREAPQTVMGRRGKLPKTSEGV